MKNLAQRWGVCNFVWLWVMACSGSSAEVAEIPGEVSGESVMRHVEEIVRHGPHPPGSEAQRRVGAYLRAQLESYGLQVHSQTFEPFTPLGRREMTNLWGVTAARRDQVLILASHYDSKYFQDRSFVGANDSGSSSGLLLELARILSANNPTDLTLWFVFFDGEEAFGEWTSADSLYGSRQFVEMLRSRQEFERISALILLDMVGAECVAIRKDANSTGWLKEIIWRRAADLGYDAVFRPRGRVNAIDDHTPFAEEGIPVIDIIDLDYAFWHRAEDTPDKLSPRNLEIVGEVVLASLPEIARRALQ